jgi:hypothetical protein
MEISYHPGCGDHDSRHIRGTLQSLRNSSRNVRDDADEGGRLGEKDGRRIPRRADFFRVCDLRDNGVARVREVLPVRDLGTACKRRIGRWVA